MSAYEIIEHPYPSRVMSSCNKKKQLVDEIPPVAHLPFKKVHTHQITDQGMLPVWHEHEGDQILIAVDGFGCYQEKDKEILPIKCGDVVFIKAGVEHWHTTLPDSEFTHIIINTGKENASVTWLQKRVKDKIS